MIRASVLLVAALLAGCGSTPVFLGEEHEGDLFVLRLTRFDGSTSIPRPLWRDMLNPGRGVNVDGCQVSGRGDPPAHFQGTLIVGDCRVSLELPEPTTPVFDFELEEPPP